MKTEILSEKVLQDILGKCLVPSEKLLKYSLTQRENENAILKVCTEEKKYEFIVMKLPGCINRNHKSLNIKTSNTVISPVFIIDGTEDFVGFNANQVKEYVLAEKLTLEHIKIFSKTLANYLPEYSSKSKEADIFCEYELKTSLNILNALYRLDDTEIDFNIFQEETERLAYSTNKLVKSDLSVHSLGYISKDQVYFKYEEGKPIECRILHSGTKKYAPLTYDVLLFLFTETDEHFRQEHIGELLDYYYKCLNTNLSKSNYEHQIKANLPFAKLEAAFHCSQSLIPEGFLQNHDAVNRALEYFKVNKNYRKSVSESLSNIVHYIKCPRFSKEDCYEVMRDVLGTSTDYEFLDYQLVPVEEKTGLLGDYFKLKININYKTYNKVFIFFAKFMPLNLSSKKIVEEGPFGKEEFFYKIFIKKCCQYNFNSVEFAPKCYFSRLNDVLIMEDMGRNNFRLPDTRAPYTYEMMVLTVKKLAKLHACTLLLEETWSKEENKVVRLDDLYEEYLEEILFKIDDNNDAYQMMENAVRIVLNYVIDLFPEVCKKLTVQEFKKRARVAYDIMYEKSKKSKKYRNVLCHGDFWATNILFQFDSNDKPTDSCIIDFQLTRYCPPSHDLLVMLYINTDKKGRKKYMPKIIEKYYQELSYNLSENNYDINDFYSHQQFLESCEYIRSQTVCLATLYTQTSMCPAKQLEDFAADQERYAYNMKVNKTDFLEDMMKCPLYKSRFRELIEDLYDVCESESYKL